MLVSYLFSFVIIRHVDRSLVKDMDWMPDERVVIITIIITYVTVECPMCNTINSCVCVCVSMCAFCLTGAFLTL